MMRLILLLSICVATIKATCPTPTELLRFSTNEGTPKKFLCARLYDHNGAAASVSCRGSYINVYNGQYIHSAGDHGWNDRVASLVVSDGCKLDVFEDGWYRGSHKQYRNVVPDLGGWNDEISSWTCSCVYSNVPLTCATSEEYIEVHRCGNPDPGSGTCSHSVEKGLTLGYSVTSGESFSHTVTASMGAIFKDIFSVGLEASTTTEYNWSSTESSDFSEVKTSTISCEVPEGTTIKIVQVVGRCADTIVYTPHFICSAAE